MPMGKLRCKPTQEILGRGSGSLGLSVAYPARGAYFGFVA